MATKKGMLNDPYFRRSLQCSKYKDLISMKNQHIADFPVERYDGEVFTVDWIYSNGLDKPIVLNEGREKLHIKLPDSSTTLSDIAQIIGPKFKVKIIEVGTQSEIEGWSIEDYANYIENYTPGHKILNMISLEISSTPLTTRIYSPRTIRQIDWIDELWPSERRARDDFPKVQKYILSGMGGAYTDFHIDFGGTSVWYHILWGQKVFYLIAPTLKNLRLYQTWICSSDQESTFFGDLVGLNECYRLVLNPGETLIIPGGWIHSVYTPIDSLVVGGNYVHSAAIISQLQVYFIEQATHVSKKYRFPYFQQTLSYALCGLLAHELQCDNDKEAGKFSLFNYPRICWQLPYLIRYCELIVENELSESELELFEDAVKALGYQSLSEVINKWWKLVEAVDVPDVSDFSFRKHVSAVRSFPTASAGVLDFLSYNFYASYPYNSTFGKEVGLKSPNAGGLKLKFSIKAELPKQGDNTTKTTSVQPAEIATKKFKFKLGTSEEPTGDSLKLKIKPTAPPAPIAKSLAKIPKERSIVQSPIAQYDSTTSLGTRRKRLSAELLNSAFDTDISKITENEYFDEENHEDDYHYSVADEDVEDDFILSDDDEEDFKPKKATLNTLKQAAKKPKTSTNTNTSGNKSKPEKGEKPTSVRQMLLKRFGGSRR